MVRHTNSAFPHRPVPPLCPLSHGLVMSCTSHNNIPDIPFSSRIAHTNHRTSHVLRTCVRNTVSHSKLPAGTTYHLYRRKITHEYKHALPTSTKGRPSPLLFSNHSLCDKPLHNAAPHFICFALNTLLSQLLFATAFSCLFFAFAAT